MVVVASQFEVYLVRLDPTEGREIRKTWACLAISPDEMNHYIDTLIVAPTTTKGRPYLTRVSVKFQGKRGQIGFDQIHTVDKARLVKRLGRINEPTANKVLALLNEMFAP